MKNKAYTSSFASIYDDVMGTVPYQVWYDYLKEILDYYQLEARKVLDLACGTGNMSLLFARDNYQVTGVDRSSGMLEVAKQKAREEELEINFIEADLCSFQLEEKFDLAISLFDSLNYILQLEDLKKVFMNVFDSLRDGGIFIFDVNTLSRLMSIEPGTTILNGEDYTCIWEDIVNEEKKLWQVKLKIYHKDTGEYHEEFHQEKGYKIADLKGALKEAEFEDIAVFNAYTFTEATDNDNRIYFVALKNRKRSAERPVLRSVKNLKWGIKRFINGL